MLSLFLPRIVVGAVTFTLLLASLVLHFLMFLPFALLKLVVPNPAWRRYWTNWLIAVGEQFSRSNACVLRLCFPVNWRVDVDPGLSRDQSYLLVCNHQSWADIVILLDVLRGRAPWPRFVLKRELMWVPIIGVACWALDFPFMRRYPRHVIERHPEKAREDLDATRRACEHFRATPATVVNYLEGTRFTQAKRRARNSRYTHLLPPKSGGLAFAVNAMGEQVHGLIDVTIAYCPTRHSLVWSFLIGEQTGIHIHVRRIEIPGDLLKGDYQNDAAYRMRFQQWVAHLWAEKDERLAELHASAEGGRLGAPGHCSGPDNHNNNPQGNP